MILHAGGILVDSRAFYSMVVGEGEKEVKQGEKKRASLKEEALVLLRDGQHPCGMLCS